MLETVPSIGADTSRLGVADAVDKNFALSLSVRTFFEHPAMVGSAFPATRWLVRRMLEPLQWQRMKLLVEFGPGTGVFTRAALDRLPPEATLLALDTSPAFVDYLKHSIQDPRFLVACAPAVDVATILRSRGLPTADCILSGLPFSTLEPREADRTMRASRSVLAPDGMFCAYQMRRTIEPLLKTHIGPIRSVREWRNIPPCHLSWAQVGPEAGMSQSIDEQEDARALQSPWTFHDGFSPRTDRYAQIDEEDPDPGKRGGQPQTEAEARPVVRTREAAPEN